MKAMRMTVAAVFVALSVSNVVAAVNFPVGTHLIKGTLKDW